MSWRDTLNGFEKAPLRRERSNGWDAHSFVADRRVETHCWEAHGFVFSVVFVNGSWSLTCPPLLRLSLTLEARDADDAKLQATKLIGEKLRRVVGELRKTSAQLQGGTNESSA